METTHVGSRGFYFILLYIFNLLLAAHAKESPIKLITNKEALDVAKQNPTGSVVYFSRSGANHDPEIRRFIGEFEKAAQALKDYGVRFHKVDCNAGVDDLKKECGQQRDYVAVYSIHNKRDLDIPVLFDEDHIVGHVLMDILDYDLSIAQDKYMWDEVLMNNKGSKDIVLGYFRGIGNKDHRMFLEAAFVYGKEYQFVVTTEKSMPGLKGDGSLWYYQCKDAAADAECNFRVRKMAPKNVLDVIGFIKLEGISRIVQIEQDGSSIYDKLDLTFPLNKVFLFSNDIKKMTKMAAEALKKIDDSFYFILVDVKIHVDLLPEFGIDLATDWDIVPGTLVLQPAHLVGSGQKYYEQWPQHMEFTLKTMIDVLSQYHKSPNKAYREVVTAVDIHYTTIDDWKKPTKGIVVVGGCMKDAQGCYEFQITFRRVARSVYDTQLELVVEFFYVDFTDHPEDAKLNGLPGFEIYKDGKEIKHIGQMDYESLLQFLWKNLSPRVRRLPLSGSDHIPLHPEEEPEEENKGEDDSVDDDDDSTSLLSMEDDSMGKLAVDIIKRKVNDENVTALKDKTFYPSKDANDLMVTLFYLPWCVKSIILREAYAKVVAKIEATQSDSDMKTVVNKMNCFDWEDVCRKENITMYPTIKIYRKGHESFTYTESLDAATLERSIRMYQNPVTKELQDAESINKYLDFEAQSEAPVSVLGLFRKKGDSEFQVFSNSAKKLFGKIPFAYATGEIAEKSANEQGLPVPMFILVKRDDHLEQLSLANSFKQISKFIEKKSLPVYGELTAVNFPKYREYKKPLLIQFKQKTEETNKVPLERLAFNTNKVFVVWMDMSKIVTKEIMRAYIKDASKPALVLVNHEKGKVFHFVDDVTNDTLVTWVKACLKQEIKPVSEFVDKKWKPLRKPYDYLKMQAAISDKKAEEDLTKEQDIPSVDVGGDEAEVEVKDEEADDGAEEPGDGAEEPGDGAEEPDDAVEEPDKDRGKSGTVSDHDEL
ncbi:thioredoxin domain-containing protein 16-like [Rhopilema esculentum]|uniref:thioredoxin domain-containing protein 16-like n=1 Tax=Rhopilema esculentum TaxID=499914 RepID=UPI0031D88230